MASDKMSLDENLRNNLVVWAAMLIGQVFFCAIAIYLVKYGAMNIEQTDLNEILLYIVPLIAVGCFSASYFLFKQRIIALKDIADLNTKIANYRSALILKWALLEGPSFFAIVAYLLTGNYLLLCVAVVIIIIFILTMPNQARFESDLELSWQDKNDITGQ